MIIPRIKPITQKRLKQLERNSGGPRYQEWRNYVLKRDNDTCQYPRCGGKEDLQVHHIRRWVDAKHLRFSTMNGITLCKRCHAKCTGREKMYAVGFFKIARANELKFKNANNI